MAMAAAVFALSAGLTATTGASVSAAPAQHPPVVAFNWWHGNHERNAHYGSVRPVTLGGRFGEPVSSLHWQTWNQQGAQGTGQIVHMSCQPCYVKVSLAHAKNMPSASGRFYNWLTVTYTRPANGGTSRLRWSFQQRNWVGR